MKNWRYLSVAVVLLAFGPEIALAQIGPGTELVGSLDQTLNSKTAQVGQTITISHAHTTNHDVNHAVIYGHVSEVQHAGQGTPGKIKLSIDKVNTQNGTVYQVTGYTSNMQVNTKSNAGKEAGAAAGGALIGGLLGHGAGAIIGGATGYLYAKNSRENVTIPSGSLVTVHVVQARRQASHP
jgi:hypothetical protein